MGLSETLKIQCQAYIDRKAIDSTTFKIARGTDSETSVGMVSKLKAAKIVMRAGIPMLIGNGMQRGALGKISADLLGTFFLPSESKLKGRKRWIAFSIILKGF